MPQFGSSLRELKLSMCVNESYVEGSSKYSQIFPGILMQVEKRTPKTTPTLSFYASSGGIVISHK